MTTSLPSPAAAARMAPTQPPQYKLHNSRYESGIEIGPWKIVGTKRPILNGKEIDAAEGRLKLPLPEMTFGNNSLSLTYNPASPLPSTPAGSTSSSTASRSDGRHEAAALSLRFDTIDALAGVATGEGWEDTVGGGVKVAMADTWGKNRSNPSALLSDTPLPSKPVKPHDWTYSTCYSGSAAGPSQFQPSSSHSIPMKLLARQDPILDQILFYEDVPLYEDELHDNGESIYNVRIRVMPHSFFILARLFLRVDNVLFRLHDIRIYHAFGTDEIVKEVSGMEADYEAVKSRLEKPSDLSPLTNPNFVSAVMASMSEGDADVPMSSTREGKPWPGLGKRVEVLRLPSGPDEVDSGLASLAIQ